MSPELVVYVLLLLFPRMSHGNRECIEQNQSRIVEQLRQAEEMGVPPALMASVAFVETHLGCDRGEGGNWGAPISPTRRHTAGTHVHAARALLTSYRVCGGTSWERAAHRFHSGMCNLSRHGRNTAYSRTVIRLTHRLWDYGFTRPWVGTLGDRR